MNTVLVLSSLVYSPDISLMGLVGLESMTVLRTDCSVQNCAHSQPGQAETAQLRTVTIVTQ